MDTQGPGGDEQYKETSKEILLDEVALAKLNLSYRLEAAKQGRWKGIRYSLSAVADSSLVESGLIVGVAEHMSHVGGQLYKQLHAGALMHANVLGGIGQVIGASGSLEEFLINDYHSLLAYRKGFSPEQARRRVKSLRNRIDGKLAALRQIADKNRSEGRIAAAELQLKEAQVLADIRDLLVSEFGSFLERRDRLLWFQQSFYLADIARNVTGAIGNLYGYKSAHQRNPVFNQPAGVLTTISGALIVADPIVARLIGKLKNSLDHHVLERDGMLEVAGSLARLRADADDFTTTYHLYEGQKEEPSLNGVVAALNVFALERPDFDVRLSTHSKAVNAGRRIAVESLLSGALVGSTKLTLGIETAIAGFRYPINPNVTNVLVGTGSIPFLAGSAFAILDNLRIQTSSEINWYRRRRKGLLSGQLVGAELDKLDTIEKAVRAL
jgi:hypothetical protein